MISLIILLYLKEEFPNYLSVLTRKAPNLNKITPVHDQLSLITRSFITGYGRTSRLIDRGSVRDKSPEGKKYLF